MRCLALMFALLACGGGKPVGQEARPRGAASSSPARAALTIDEMLAGFPADVGIIMAADIAKLRSSPLAHKIWDAVDEEPAIQQMLEGSCGGVKEIKYVMAGMAAPDAPKTWMWMRGLAQDAKLTGCSQQTLESIKKSKTTSKDNYTLMEDATPTEMAWDDRMTALVVYHKEGSKPVGHEELQRAIDVSRSRRISNADLAALVDRVDTDAGIWMFAAGSALKLEGVAAVIMSLDVDRGARARVYMLFDSDDRASELAAGYRAALPKLEQQGLIESGEARAEGRAMSGSIAINEAQADWWLQLALTQRAGSNAPPPPPPRSAPH